MLGTRCGNGSEAVDRVLRSGTRSRMGPEVGQPWEPDVGWFLKL